jgi:hypothetical protein
MDKTVHLLSAGHGSSRAGIAGTRLGTLLRRLFLTGFPEMLYSLTQFLLECWAKRNVRCYSARAERMVAVLKRDDVSSEIRFWANL